MRVTWGPERDLTMRTEILILYEVFTLLQTAINCTSRIKPVFCSIVPKHPASSGISFFSFFLFKTFVYG